MFWGIFFLRPFLGVPGALPWLVSLCRIGGPPVLLSSEGPPKEACRLPHLGATMEEPAVFMQRCFQRVNNTEMVKKILA